MKLGRWYTKTGFIRMISLYLFGLQRPLFWYDLYHPAK